MTSTADRKVQILTCSAELFATKGVAATTVRDIGESAGVFSGSLYHYFKSKSAIVVELLDIFMEDIKTRFDLIETTASTPEDVIRGLIRETLTVIHLHPHATAIYQNEQNYLRGQGLLKSVDSASHQFRTRWLTALQRGVEEGTFRDDVDPEVFYRMARETLWSTNRWANRDKYTLFEFTELMTTLLFSGFCMTQREPWTGPDQGSVSAE